MQGPSEPVRRNVKKGRKLGEPRRGNHAKGWWAIQQPKGHYRL